MMPTKTVVIDSGSEAVKSGLAGNYAPSSIISTVVGISKFKEERVRNDEKYLYIGEEAREFQDRCNLDLIYPLENGIVTDWDQMEVIWRESLTELKIEPTECHVMLTGSYVNTKVNKEKQMEIMFEKFGVPAVYVADQFALAMYSAGKTTGVVVEIGAAVSTTVPVYEGYSLPHAMTCLDIAGRQLSKHLAGLLASSGVSCGTSGVSCGTSGAGNLNSETVKDIKEKLCYVALDYENELQKCKENNDNISTSYELPDGQVVDVKQPRFQCPEALFKPSLVGLSCYGLHQNLHSSIMKCDVDMKSTSALYENIVLCGGSSQFPGLCARLEKELRALTSCSSPREIKIRPGDEYGVFVGGAILASLSTFQQMWVYKQEFEEHGPSIVHKKCF